MEEHEHERRRAFYERNSRESLTRQIYEKAPDDTPFLNAMKADEEFPDNALDEM